MRILVIVEHLSSFDVEDKHIAPLILSIIFIKIAEGAYALMSRSLYQLSGARFFYFIRTKPSETLTPDPLFKFM